MINKHKVGLTVGGFAGLVHIVWSVLVAVKLAQPLTDFILRLHFMDMPRTVGAFEISTAVGLVVVASVVGYAAGFVFSAIWNLVHKGM